MELKKRGRQIISLQQITDTKLPSGFCLALGDERLAFQASS
jgi:hypothetical protein